ncbi:DUF7575 domain-containing protein [Halomontanus rarus]|uniref:DUF7575 domain-containing protein n=1 Tax=Halomontanus rarus TaxID=3034020 RepID=UPI0023E76836|nr:DUF6677 family protein [Halovivax sp. TS33]
MGTTASTTRPWLAVLFGLLVTGFGHLYLRRWRRAAGWILLVIAVSSLFVPTAAIETLAAEEMPPLHQIAPLLLATGASVVDAYILAVRSKYSDAQPSTRPPTHHATETVSCPNCGKTVDPELEFCHWCTTRLTDADPDSDDRE